MNDDFRARVQAALDEAVATKNTTPRALALGVGGKPDLFRQVLDPKRSKNPRVDTIRLVAQALGKSEDWLINGPPTEAPIPPGEPLPPPAQEVRRAPIPVPVRADMARNVPVLGTAAGSIIHERIEGFVMFNGDPIDYVRRPAALEAVTTAYAIYVVGDSMAPALHQGDLQFVHPGRPARPGDMVVVQTRHHDSDPGQAYIKVLVRRSGERIVLRQYNPVAEIEIPVRFIVSIHKVMTINDLYGA